MKNRKIVIYEPGNWDSDKLIEAPYGIDFMFGTKRYNIRFDNAQDALCITEKGDEGIIDIMPGARNVIYLK